MKWLGVIAAVHAARYDDADGRLTVSAITRICTEEVCVRSKRLPLPVEPPPRSFAHRKLILHISAR